MRLKSRVGSLVAGGIALGGPVGLSAIVNTGTYKDFNLHPVSDYVARVAGLGAAVFAGVFGYQSHRRQHVGNAIAAVCMMGASTAFLTQSNFTRR